MHGLKTDHFYKTSQEKEKFNKNLEKGYKLLDLFVEYSSKLERTNTLNSVFREITDLDEKMFELSTAIIEFMPEFTPSWNYRKKYIQMKKGKDRKALQESLMSERNMTQKCLKTSPKSYSVWHHRLWTLTCLFNIKVEKLHELLVEEHHLCFKLFKYDGRNFHCWSYYNFVRHYMKLLKENSGKQEIKVINNNPEEFDKLSTTEVMNLIKEKFSNYSAWFQRSNLPYKDDSPKEDLEILKHALYTDPYDQSLWNYYNWLLFKRNALSKYVCYHNYEEETMTLNLYFNTPLRLDVDSSHLYKTSKKNVLLFSDSEKVKGVWSARDSKYGLGFVWSFKFDALEELNNLLRAELVLAGSQTSHDFYSNLLNNKNFFNNEKETPKRDSEFRGENDLKLVYKFYEGLQLELDNPQIMEKESDDNWVESGRLEKPLKVGAQLLTLGKEITFATLKEQLEVIDDLISIDSESKYLLIAKIKLLEYLGREEEAEGMLEKLAVLDPPRKNYYVDMLTERKIRSKLKLSDHRERRKKDHKVDLSRMSLSKLSFNTFVPFFGLTHLSLANNKLTTRSLNPIGSFLLLLEELDLSENSLENLPEILDLLRNLQRLRKLNLSKNPLKELSPDTALESQIKQIDLSETPISSYLESEGLAEPLEEKLIFGSYTPTKEANKGGGKESFVIFKVEN